MFRALTASCALCVALLAFTDTAQAQRVRANLPGRFTPDIPGVGGVPLDAHDHVGIGDPGGPAVKPLPGIGQPGLRVRPGAGCTQTYCPPVYKPKPQCYYIVQCRPIPCWRYASFPCYDEAYRFLCQKRKFGFDVCLVKYCHGWKVKYRKLCGWKTYRQFGVYQDAVYYRGGMIDRGYEVRIVRR